MKDLKSGNVVPKTFSEDSQAKGLSQGGIPTKTNDALQEGAKPNDTMGKGQGEVGAVDIRG